MSFKLVKECIAAQEIEGMHKLVLIILADMVNEANGGCAWPSMSTVAVRAGCSPRHVQRITRQLEQEGFLTIRRQTGINGTNKFFVHPKGGDTHVTPGGDTHVRGGVTPMSWGGRHPGHPGGDTHVTQIDKEHIGIDNVADVAASPEGGGSSAVEIEKSHIGTPCLHDPTQSFAKCPECKKAMKEGTYGDTPKP